jgi:hypothetical protein
MAAAPVDGCRAFTDRGGNDPFDFGATAAIHCAKPVRDVRQVASFRFPDGDAMAGYWAWRVDQVEPTLRPRDGACADGRRGLARWEHGALVCYVSGQPKVARLRWIDERSGTYGVIDATDRDIRGLFENWSTLMVEGLTE